VHTLDAESVIASWEGITVQENNESRLHDIYMANGLMLEVFMLQISLDMARQQENPKKWARNFVDQLHSRIDGNETRMIEPMRRPIHELSRQGFDRLGSTLQKLLANLGK
jgi:hypothetical protein